MRQHKFHGSGSIFGNVNVDRNRDEEMFSGRALVVLAAASSGPNAFVIRARVYI